MAYNSLRDLIKIRIIAMPNEMWNDIEHMDNIASKFLKENFHARKSLVGNSIYVREKSAKPQTVESLLFDTVNIDHLSIIPTRIKRVLNEF